MLAGRNFDGSEGVVGPKDLNLLTVQVRPPTGIMAVKQNQASGNPRFHFTSDTLIFILENPRSTGSDLTWFFLYAPLFKDDRVPVWEAGTDKTAERLRVRTCTFHA